MKRFLWNIVVFCSIMGALLAIVEYAVGRVPTSYSRKAEYMDAHSDSLDLLVLGSSHAFTGIDPALLSRNGYSLANFSQTLYFDYKLLEKYINQCPNLRTVILTVSVFSLYGELEDGSESGKQVWYDKSFDICKYPLNPTVRWEILSAPNSIPFKLKTFYWDGEEQSYITPAGMSTLYQLDKKDSLLWDQGAVAAKRHYATGTPKPKIVEYLYQISRLCQKHNVKLYLVTPPARASYILHCDPVQINYMVQTTTDLIDQFENTYYLNYFSDTSLTNHADYFYDADHLSNVGADAFTKLLFEALNP